jgi:hypothetical protein
MKYLTFLQSLRPIQTHGFIFAYEPKSMVSLGVVSKPEHSELTHVLGHDGGTPDLSPRVPRPDSHEQPVRHSVYYPKPVVFVRDFYEILDSQTVYVRWRYSAGLKFATSVPLEPSKCEKVR